MANFEAFDYTQSWILTKYSKFIHNNSKNQNFNSKVQAENWETLNGNELICPLVLCLTPTNFLMIKHDNEIQEFINLWTSKSSLKGVYKGNSLLVMHKMKDFIRKFRVQFASSKFKTGQENCMSCIHELNRFFPIMDNNGNSLNSSSDQAQENSSQSMIQPARTCSTSGNHKSCDKDEESCFRVKDLTKMLMEKNEHKLPLFYQENSESELLQCQDDSDKSLKEFFVCCLLDPKFPAFVKKVDNFVSEILTDEMKF